jgi:hypothetical protein
MHIAEKYTALARDATAAGDNVAAENYLQHAEHYNRIIMAAQPPQGGLPAVEGGNGLNGARPVHSEAPVRDFDSLEGEEEEFPAEPRQHYHEPSPNYRQHQQPQPYVPREAFPQTQPLPQPAIPNVNGASAQPAHQSGYPDHDRGPRRRRRRPMGDGQRIYGGPRNGADYPEPATATAPAPTGGEPGPDEAAS